MSALQVVENCLAELNNLTTFLSENASSIYVDPTALVQDLQKTVISEIQEDQLGKSLSSLGRLPGTLFE